MIKALLETNIKYGSSSSGGVTTIIPKPTTIVFCLHGMNGDENTFSGFQKTQTDYNTYQGSFLSGHITSETNAEDIKSRVLYRSFMNDKILFIKVLFKDNTGHVYDQTEELRSMSQTVHNVFGNGPKYGLLGHSKGGLVIIDYINKYGALKEFTKILTFGTPYAYLASTELAEWLYKDKTIGNEHEMNSIRDKWNSLDPLLRPTATAIGTNVIINSDPYVHIANATANSHDGIVGIEWKKFMNFDYEHSNMLKTRDAVNFTCSYF